MYLCKFDASGKRTATVVDGVHYATTAEKQKYLDDGYIETSDDDYAYYVGNRGAGANGTGYIRGADGKPTDAPAYELSKEKKLAELDAQYDKDKAEIIRYYNEAIFAEDTETMADLKEEMAEIDAKYKADRKAIEEGSEE